METTPASFATTAPPRRSRQNSLRRLTVSVGAGVVSFFLSVSVDLALALPKPGERVPSLTIEDAWERRVDIDRLGRKPLLLVYEDEKSAKQNTAFKEELSRMAKGDRYKQKVVLLAVADLDGYDYWPVRGFVRDAIKSESRKQNLPIFCDWQGRMREKLGLVRGQSNIVLYDKNGELLFSHAGELSSEQRKAVLGQLRAQLGEASP
ncbi:MAG: YtfJ family protein [Polyangiaceae bacterium]